MPNDKCQNRKCQKPIRVMAFRGLRWCSDDCRKVIQAQDERDKEASNGQGLH